MSQINHWMLHLYVFVFIIITICADYANCMCASVSVSQLARQFGAGADLIERWSTTLVPLLINLDSRVVCLCCHYSGHHYVLSIEVTMVSFERSSCRQFELRPIDYYPYWFITTGRNQFDRINSQPLTGDEQCKNEWTTSSLTIGLIWSFDSIDCIKINRFRVPFGVHLIAFTRHPIFDLL